MLNNLILILMATIPVVILLKFAFYEDKVEKEPPSLLFKLFIAGIISTIMVLLLTYLSKNLIKVHNNFYNSFIQVALIEEVCKWVCVYIITWHNKEFNYKFDAIVYCIFVSLGFAFIENIGYAINYGLTTALIRDIVSVPCHAFFAIYMGYYLGLAKEYRVNNNNECYTYAIYSVLIPTLLHGIYNFCLISSNDILYIIFVGFIIALYILSFKTIASVSNSDTSLEHNN